MKLAPAATAITLALISQLAGAGPADYIYTPAVEYGEREIDFKAGSAKLRDTPRESAMSIGFGYGAKDWWFTEIYAKYKRISPDGTFLDAAEWENKFQLTEPGEYPVDVGFLLEIERPRDHAEGWEVKWGPLLQKDLGKWQLNGNILFVRAYRSDTPNDLSLEYQWQAKYRWMQALELGLQGFGEVGKWDDWAPSGERSSRAGPAVFGKIPLGQDRTAIRYNAAWLIGKDQGIANHTVRLQVEYEF